MSLEALAFQEKKDAELLHFTRCEFCSKYYGNVICRFIAEAEEIQQGI